MPSAGMSRSGFAGVMRTEPEVNHRAARVQNLSAGKFSGSNRCPPKFKAWWNNDILAPITNKRNQARKWMLIAHSVQASDCYQYWQAVFKNKVLELKRNHWRKFLLFKGTSEVPIDCDISDIQPPDFANYFFPPAISIPEVNNIISLY